MTKKDVRNMVKESLKDIKIPKPMQIELEYEYLDPFKEMIEMYGGVPPQMQGSPQNSTASGIIAAREVGMDEKKE